MRLTGLTLPILLGALLILVVTVVTKPGTEPRLHFAYPKGRLGHLPRRDWEFRKREPEVIKEGECPQPPKHYSTCSLQSNTENGNCTGDQHCYGTQKCCLYNCKNICIEPAVMKHGGCRANSIPPRACVSWLLEGGCRSDQECDGAQKCCIYECRYKCRDPEV